MLGFSLIGFRLAPFVDSLYFSFGLPDGRLTDLITITTGKLPNFFNCIWVFKIPNHTISVHFGGISGLYTLAMSVWDRLRLATIRSTNSHVMPLKRLAKRYEWVK